MLNYELLFLTSLNFLFIKLKIKFRNERFDNSPLERGQGCVFDYGITENYELYNYLTFRSCSLFIFFTHYFYYFLLVFVNLLRRFVLPKENEPKEKALYRQVFFKDIYNYKFILKNTPAPL
jgi:hypothetical protein